MPNSTSFLNLKSPTTGVSKSRTLPYRCCSSGGRLSFRLSTPRADKNTSASKLRDRLHQCVLQLRPPNFGSDDATCNFSFGHPTSTSPVRLQCAWALVRRIIQELHQRHAVESDPSNSQSILLTVFELWQRRTLLSTTTTSI